MIKRKHRASKFKRMGIGTRALVNALVRAKLRPGEVAIPSGCSDIAGCGCVHHQCAGQACTVIGRNPARDRDRCLVCGASWRSRDYRWQRLVGLRRPKSGRAAYVRAAVDYAMGRTPC